jgi:hypothetical protein
MIESYQYQDDYENSLKTLEDIQYLSGFSVAPLISSAYFHLSEMKRKADVIKNGQVSGFESVLKVLDLKIEDIFNEYFASKRAAEQFIFRKDNSNINLEKWNLIFEIIPEVLSVVSLFNFQGKVETHLSDTKLIVAGFIRPSSSIEFNRKFIYVITRKLLHKNVLLTFAMHETGKSGLFKLELITDYSHDPNLIFKVLFKPKFDESIYLGFSNTFCNYRSNIDNIKKSGNHHVVEIGNNLELKLNSTIVDLSRLESANKEILHFPFIFRPVSIILPIKGNLSTEFFLKNFVNNSMKDYSTKLENDETKRKQDVLFSYQYIDFFSLFNL